MDIGVTSVDFSSFSGFTAFFFATAWRLGGKAEVRSLLGVGEGL